MARLKRICDACNKPIPQSGEHWHMVEKTVEPERWELFKAFLRGKQLPVVTKRVPQHHNCQHPEQRSPVTFIGIEPEGDFFGVESSLPDHMEKEFENI